MSLTTRFAYLFPDYSDTYPHLDAFLRQHVEMQLKDVRTMLQLPIDITIERKGQNLNLEAGCNFAITAILLNLISGFSVMLYDPTRDRKERGKRFKNVVKDHFPWDDEKVPSTPGREDAADLFWELLRNPIAHRLGVDVPDPSIGVASLRTASKVEIHLVKSPLQPALIAKLEHNGKKQLACPYGIRPIISQSSSASETFIEIPALYWAIIRVAHSLLNKENWRKAADSIAEECGF